MLPPIAVSLPLCLQMVGGTCWCVCWYFDVEIGMVGALLSAQDAHIKREGNMVNDKGVRCITRYKNLGDASKDVHIKREGYMVNDKGVWCITGYKNLGDVSKEAHIKREGYMVNDKGVLCITGYKLLGNSYGKLGSNALKDMLIKREGYMVNNKGVLCITGYTNLGDVSKDAHIEREGYVVNDKGVRCITGYKNLGKEGAEARAKNARATALSEHHSHICISAICQKGVSIKWEGEDVRMYHHCYDPE